MRMKSKQYFADIFFAATRALSWDVIALQMAAFELENNTTFLPDGHAVDVGRAGEHSRSVVIAVKSIWVSFVNRVGHVARSLYIDFAFRTGSLKVRRMRIGSAHLPPESAHHSDDEFVDVLHAWEQESKGLRRRSLQFFGAGANVSSTVA